MKSWEQYLGRAVVDHTEYEGGTHPVRRVTLHAGEQHEEYIFRPAAWREAFYQSKCEQRGKLLPWLRLLGWFAARLALILVIMLGPDMRDRTALQQLKQDMPNPLNWRQRIRYYFSGPRADVIVGPVLRALWRLGALVMATALSVVGIVWHPLVIGGLLAGGVLAAALSLLWPAGHIAAQVAAIANSAEDLTALTDAITRDLAWLQQRSERICVVAHSMGGYLIYRLLASQNRPKNMKDVQVLLTVGSGLRPMHILSSTGPSRKWVMPSLMTMLALFGIVAEIAPMLIAFTKALTGIFLSVSIAGEVSGMTPAAMSQPQVIDTSISMTKDAIRTASTNALSEVSNLNWLSVLLICGELAFACYLLRHELRAALSPLTLRTNGRHNGLVWRDYTSPSDSVGRLGSFASPDSQNILVPEVGNPLIDHVRGFGQRSITARLLALDLLSLSDVDQAALTRWVTAADNTRLMYLARFGRRRRLHGITTTLVLSIITICVGTGRFSFAVGITLANAAALVLSVLFSRMASRAAAQAVTKLRQAGSTETDRTTHSVRARLYLGLSIILFACILLGATMDLGISLGEYQSAPLLPSLEFLLLLAIIVLLLACGSGVIAGYDLRASAAQLSLAAAVVLAVLPPLSWHAPISSKPGIVAAVYALSGWCFIKYTQRKDKREHRSRRSADRA